MQEARVIHTRLLFGEGSKPDTEDSTVNAPSSAKKTPSYLRLLPRANIDPSHLLAEPVLYPQLPEPNPEAYARYLQVQEYTSVEAQAKRAAVRAASKLQQDAGIAVQFTLAASLVGACTIDGLIRQTFFVQRKRPSFDHLREPIRY
jgi:hypothetical protein